MRILPVNNYNYQSKTQNNKQQNVNFGMLKGNFEITQKFCDLANFFNVGIALRNLVERVKTPIDVAIREKGLVQRKFNDQEISALLKLVSKAEKDNVIMSKDEKDGLEVLIRMRDPEVETNARIIEYIDQLITHADEIKGPKEDKITIMEVLQTRMDELKTELQQASVANYRQFM